MIKDNFQLREKRMWSGQFEVNVKNKGIKESEQHWIIQRIENIQLDDLLTDVSVLQGNIERWALNYSEYEEVRIDHVYSSHDDRTEYFLSGIRKETEAERLSRIAELKAQVEKTELDNKRQSEDQINKKRELLKKLKLELGEN